MGGIIERGKRIKKEHTSNIIGPGEALHWPQLSLPNNFFLLLKYVITISDSIFELALLDMGDVSGSLSQKSPLQPPSPTPAMQTQHIVKFRSTYSALNSVICLN